MEDTSQRLNKLRGIFALIVVLGHAVRYESCLLSPFGNFMLICVGFFFYISGMGLSISYNTKENYLDNFISKRFLKLIYIALLALVFTTVIAFISPIKTNFANIPESLRIFIRAIFVRTNWYIRELLLLYLMFYVVFKYFKRGKCLIITCLCIILCFVMFLLGYTRCWFASILCFPLGIASVQYYEQFSSLFRKAIGKAMIALLLVIGLSFKILNNFLVNNTDLSFSTTEFIFSFGNNILCIGFILLLFTVIMKFEFDNPVLRFFTRYSTELYVFQFVFLEMAENAKLTYLPKAAMIFVSDLVVSVILHKLFVLYPFKNNNKQ